MNYPIFFNSTNSLNLFGLKNNFNFISSLYSKQKLPKVLMFSGTKGSGKSTLINHFLYSIFDPQNYDRKEFILSKNSSFFTQFKSYTFPNIIYLNGDNFKSIKVEDIRNLKKTILKTSISNLDRFIIFDDVDIFNQNSLNALLKIIEEPAKKNYFFLINNKSNQVLETIKSRALEINIILAESQRLEIIDNLVSYHELKLVLDPKTSNLSPGNFIKFNHICNEYNISPTNDLIENLKLLLSLHKKNKDILFINMAFFMVDYYFKYLKDNRLLKIDNIYEVKNYIFNHLNNYILYNINQTSIINNLSEKLNYE